MTLPDDVQEAVDDASIVLLDIPENQTWAEKRLLTLARYIRDQATKPEHQCETCRYQDHSRGIPCCAKVSVPGHSVAVVACRALGNGCNAWTERRT